MNWFKLHHEARNDAKLRSLNDQEFRVWFNLLCLSSEQKDRGHIESQDMDLLAVEVAHGDTELLTATVSKLLKLRIISSGDDINFEAWEKRQYDKPSATPERVSARVRKSRSRKATPKTDTATPCNDAETQCNALEQNRTDTEQNRADAREATPGVYDPDENLVASELVELGLAPSQAAALSSKFGSELIRRQIRWLPYREAKNPAAMLAKSIQDDYPEPSVAIAEEHAARSRLTSSPTYAGMTFRVVPPEEQTPEMADQILENANRRAA